MSPRGCRGREVGELYDENAEKKTYARFRENGMWIYCAHARCVRVHEKNPIEFAAETETGACERPLARSLIRVLYVEIEA